MRSLASRNEALSSALRPAYDVGAPGQRRRFGAERGTGRDDSALEPTTPSYAATVENPDPGRWAIRLGAVLNEWTDSGITPEGPRVSVVGNVLLHGVDTPAEREFVGSNSNGAAYLEDNLAFDRAGAPALIAGATVAQLSEPPSWPRGLVALPASSVLEHVLGSAGARPRDRDVVDERIVADVRARSGNIIDSQDEVGGYPVAVATRRPLEVPADVDAWLDAMAAELE